MNIKQFFKNHKKKIIIGAVIASATVISILATKYPKTAEVILPKLFNNTDLPKPDWEGFEINEHWTENGVQNMILSTFAYRLGEFGEHLMDDILTQANPDIPIEMIISYSANHLV